MGLFDSIVGGIVGDFFGGRASDRQYEANSALAEQQNEWNVENYKHRYQWQMDDMRAAGLNPILSANLGAGSPHAASLASVGMAQNTGYGDIGMQRNQMEIAKMSNAVEKGKLKLAEEDINSAISKRENDMKLDNARYDLDKWQREYQMDLAKEMNDAQIQNMRDRLEAEIAHWERQDYNGAQMAQAALASAAASGLLADVARMKGISEVELNKAREAYIAIESNNGEEALKWQRWLNDHPQTRGAVGFIGSFLDSVGLATRTARAAYTGVKSVGTGSEW